ncbi:MAG: hypothetical protein JWO40_70 [Candidatus Doudnabacteria bacterium]|nr:hypothetical protein [Candidatus Doudnabacteria bacterium]
MIESHRREDDAPLAQHLHVENKAMFPTFASVDADLAAAVLSLLIVLLPGIILKIMAFNANALTQPNLLATSAPFVNSTLLIAFVLAVYALARAKSNPSTRTIAILTLVVCILRFILPG